VRCPEAFNVDPERISTWRWMAPDDLKGVVVFLASPVEEWYSISHS